MIDSSLLFRVLILVLIFTVLITTEYSMSGRVILRTTGNSEISTENSSPHSAVDPTGHRRAARTSARSELPQYNHHRNLQAVSTSLGDRIYVAMIASDHPGSERRSASMTFEHGKGFLLNVFLPHKLVNGTVYVNPEHQGDPVYSRRR